MFRGCSSPIRSDEGWAVRRGYQAWYILAWGEGEVT